MKISIAEASLLALFLETLSCGTRSFIEGILPPDSLSRRPEQPCSTLYLPALFILLTKALTPHPSSDLVVLTGIARVAQYGYFQPEGHCLRRKK